MILKVTGIDDIMCDRVEKGSNYIKCYNKNNLVICDFSGISDFSIFSVEGGEFSEPPIDDITQLQLAIAELAELVVGGA